MIGLAWERSKKRLIKEEQKAIFNSLQKEGRLDGIFDMRHLQYSLF
jgi:hypothetical protein